MTSRPVAEPLRLGLIANVKVPPTWKLLLLSIPARRRMLTAIDEPKTAIECLRLGAYDYLIKPLNLDELEVALQGALRRRQLEIDRRELEHWLAREVAQRTHDLEQRTNAIADIAVQALAAAPAWEGAAEAKRRLARELGTPLEELERDIEKHR